MHPKAKFWSYQVLPIVRPLGICCIALQSKESRDYVYGEVEMDEERENELEMLDGEEEMKVEKEENASCISTANSQAAELGALWNWEILWVWF